MASMQQQQHLQHQQGGRHLDGIDNPALDLGPHSGSNGHIHSSVASTPYSSGGNKMSSGYNYSDSSASQSLSLSSSNSNTDSLDTVIYKGPSQSTTSIRDWQRSMETNGDFSRGHRNDANNSYNRDSSGMFDGRSSYQMQQTSSYQPMPAANGGGNTYAMEYRHSQQQHQVQQNLSVHSIPSSSTGNNGGNISTLGASTFSNNNNNMRSGNGTAYGSNPQLPTKSPMLSHKQFSTASAQHQTDNRVNNPSSTNPSEPMLIDKSSKDSTKLFPTKTYNHIKDMISSRFGTGNGASSGSSGVSSNNNSKGLNNAVHTVNGGSGGLNGSVSNNSHLATNGGSGNMSSNPTNSYIDLTMGVPASYHNGHHHVNSNGSAQMNGHMQSSSYNNSNGVLPNRSLQQQQHNNNNGPSYYPQSSSSSNPNPSAGMMNGNAPESYRSPNMSDRKNVNTSFRKAIQQSTLKSNLAEDSLQLRPIMESSSQQNYNNNARGMQQQQYSQSNGNAIGNKNPPSSSHPQQQQQYDHETVQVQERAQRALDKLMEGGISLQRNGSGPMVNNSNSNPNATVYTRIQQFSPSTGGYSEEGHFIPGTTKSSIQQQHNQSHPSGSTSFPHDKIRYQIDPNNPSVLGRPNGYNVKPGPGSSNSNSSSGLAVIESSLSSPGSYSGNRIPGGNHNSNQNNDEIHNQKQQQQQHNNQNSQWTHLQHHKNSSSHDQPPPLPTSQKPDSSSSAVGSINTIGLPLPSVIPAETRENGDGSSATMETTTGNILLESSSTLCSKSKSDQLKQITTDLQNIALSVAAEHHMHNNSNNNHSSSSECEKGPQRVGSGQSHTTTDSGLGTVMLTKSPLNSNSDPSEHSGLIDGRPNADSVSSGNDSEWVDLVEPEIQNILEIERSSKSGKLRNPSGINPGGNNGIMLGAITSTPAATSSKPSQQQGGNSSSSNNNPGNNSTNLNSNIKSQGGNSGMLGDITASPIPHTRQTHSPVTSPKLPKKFDLNNYNKKGIRNQSQELLAVPSTSQAATGAISKVKSPRVSAKVARSNSGSGQRWSNRQQRMVDKSPKTGGSRQNKDHSQTLKGAKLTRNAMNKLGQILYSLQDETGDMTSTTGLDFESALDGHTEFTTDDDDLSTTIDTTDAHAIRRQLESLESMYTEVLKVLGEKKFSRNRYPPNTAELRNAKRRPYGSMSSLPSSVSSRPFRERSKKVDDKKKVKDLKSINRRFQRLESHVVTLARSVAHLSSEMRTQHLMVQEMESIRNELQTLRNQVVKNTMHNHSTAAAAAQNFNRVASGRHGTNPCANQTDWTSFRNAMPSRVRKLTKFFGDEPPLIRIFLKKLGYEKYAPAFEQERIGIMELPYLTEERLNKMGIPMGPRLRILQEAQMCLKPGYHGQTDGHHSHHPNNHTTGNLSVYVV